MNRSLNNLLIRSFDAALNPQQQKKVAAARAASDEFRSAEKDLADLRVRLRLREERTFNSFFAERVVDRLRNPRPTIEEYYVSAFRRLAAGAALLVLLMSAYNVTQSNAISLDSALGIHRSSLEQALTLEAPFE